MKIRFCRVLILLGALFASGLSVAAGVIKDAKIEGIYCGIFNGANMCSIYFDKSAVSSPSCAVSHLKLRMQISTETNIGRSMLSLALTAHSTGKTVFASGTGTCSVWSDTEDLNSIFIAPPCSKTNDTAGCTNQ